MVKPDDPEHMRELDQIAQEKFNKTFEECDPHERIQVRFGARVGGAGPISCRSASRSAARVMSSQPQSHSECDIPATIFLCCSLLMWDYDRCTVGSGCIVSGVVVR